MASKEQERKALEQIKEIIDSVGGNDSYIGMAFAGCCEVAADNIENDFGNSYNASLEHVRKELREQREQKYRSYEKYAEVKIELDRVKDVSETQEYKIAELEQEIKTLKENEAVLVGQLEDADQDASNMYREIESLNEEIIVLKAKLYDLISQ